MRAEESRRVKRSQVGHPQVRGEAGGQWQDWSGAQMAGDDHRGTALWAAAGSEEV